MIFNRINYPKCPSCSVLINDPAIFSLRDLQSPYFQIKTCLSCNEQFLMKVRINLDVEVEEVDDDYVS